MWRTPVQNGFDCVLLLCLTCGVPLSWGKTAGGDRLMWVGLEILLRSPSVGLVQRRAEWLIKWTTQVATAGTTRMASFEEGLGRVMFVVGALEHERLFLGPLYRFMTVTSPQRCSTHSALCGVHPSLSVGADREAEALPLWKVPCHRRLLSQSRRTGERSSDRPRGLVPHSRRRRNS